MIHNIILPPKIFPYSDTLQYHQDNITASKQFVKAYEDVKTNVDFGSRANEHYQSNTHVVKRIIEAILLYVQRNVLL